MDAIILTLSMPQFPDHGLELVMRQPTLERELGIVAKK